MKLQLPLSLARPLAFAAVTTRLLMGIFLDLPWLYNAGWIAPKRAILLCLPQGLLADRGARLSRRRKCRSAGNARRARRRTARLRAVEPRLHI